MRNKYRLFAGLVAFSAFFAMAATRVRFSEPMPDFMQQVQEWASSGRIAETFTPIAYPLSIAPAYRGGGIHAIIALQAALQIALVATCFFFLLQSGVSRWAAVLGSLPIAIHPELLLSISRLWDVALSTFLLVLVVLLFLRIQAVGLSLGLSLVGGLGFAIGAFCRPNYLVLALALLYAISSGRKVRHNSVSSFLIFKERVVLANILIFVASTVFTYCFLGIIGHGSPFFPQNGSYNLFAGNNPYSASAFLTSLNGESSIDQAYRARHPEIGTSTTDYHDHSLNGFYLRSSIGYVRQQPFSEVKLIAIKLFTLFRPDIRSNSTSRAVGVVKYLLALPVVFFLFLLALPGRARLDRVDRLLLVVYVVYILPFLLTNSDPRFRIPLDVLLLLHCSRLLELRVKATDKTTGSDAALIGNKEVSATFS